MNYPQSQQILEKIKSCQKIILNCHYNPDPDSVGAALSLYQVLKNMGKDVSVFSPTEVWSNLSFLPYLNDIKVMDFSQIDYSNYDLFIALDSSTWEQAIGNKEFLQPDNIDFIVIDHHKSNSGYGKVNLIQGESVSTCEILAKVFGDWNINVDEKIATTLLTGIVGDSGAFRYPATAAETLTIAGDLMSKGADKNEIIFNLYQTIEYPVLKFWGLCLSKLQFENNFVWVAIPNSELKEIKIDSKAKSSFASMFLQNIKDTDFGFIAVEEKPGLLDVSLRSRTGFDTSKIAVELGGGGHIWASGGRIEGLLFNEAVEKILSIARKYAKS